MASREDTLETFALLLRRHRERRGLAKAKLARLLGVSSGYVYLLEKGKTAPPTLERVQKLIELFELTQQEAEALTLTAAAGRTGAAEAKVLRQTGPRQAAFTGPAIESEGATDSPNRIDLRDCVAVPVPTDAMAPVLCEGQLAICTRARNPNAGDIVIATLQDGQVCLGQYYPSGHEVLFTALRPAESAMPPSVARSSIRELLPVIGVLFQHEPTLE